MHTRLLRVAMAAVAMAGVSLLFSPCDVAAEAGLQRENELKAAYLFNFAKFVEWPADASPGALSVCFLNSPAVLDAFATSIADRRIGTRAVIARAVGETQSLHGCDVLYLGGAALGASSPGAEKFPAVLSVSEAEDFIHHGGIIELFAEGNRLHFRINLANAHRAGLRISSNLLQLASSVEREKSP